MTDPIPAGPAWPILSIRKRHLFFGLTLLAGLGMTSVIAAGPEVETVAQLAPPPGTHSWQSAVLLAEFEKSDGSGNHGNLAPDSYEQSELTLVVTRTDQDEAERYVLAGIFQYAPWFWQRSVARALVHGDFVLRVSPDGQWIGVSRDGGRHVQPVYAAGPLLTCEHRGLVDTQSAEGWGTWPSARALAIDILGGEASRSPDAARPGPPANVIDGHFNETSELQMAAHWALAHPDARGIPEAAARAVMTTDFSFPGEDLDASMASLGALATLTNGVLRGQLVAALERPDPKHLNRAGMIAVMLDGAPDVPYQAVLADSLLTLIGPQAPSDPNRDDGAHVLGEPVREIVWRLARTAFREQRVTAETESAARALLQLLASNRVAHARRDSTHDDAIWSFWDDADAGTATYALQILGLAQTETARAFLAGLPLGATTETAQWPPRYVDPVLDADFERSLPLSDGPDAEASRTEAASSRTLARLPSPSAWLIRARQVAGVHRP